MTQQHGGSRHEAGMTKVGCQPSLH